MTVFDRAIKALNDVDEAIDHLADNEAYVTALEAQGLLMPDLRIIRTLEEIEALDPGSVTIDNEGNLDYAHRWLDDDGKAYPHDAGYLLAVVTATGAQIREVLEQDNE